MAFCSQCGTTLPDGARFCPKCGADVGAATDAPVGFAAAPQPGPGPQVAPPPTREGSSFILPVVIVVALAVIGFFLWSQRDGARPIAGNESAQVEKAGEDTEGAKGADASGSPSAAAEKPAAAAAPPADTSSTSAASLDSAFDADPQAARDRYAGPVTVSGVIATMVTPGPTPSLSLEGRTRLNFIVVNFPSGYGPRLARLAKGQRITVSCGSVTSLAGTTILQNCAL